MKRVEFLLITLMVLCAFVFLNACGKHSDDNTGGTPSQPVTYTYNQQPCTQNIISLYDRINQACSRTRSYRQHRNCMSLAQAFLAQYPRLNCRMALYPGYSTRYKYTSISETDIYKKMEESNPSKDVNGLR